MLVALDFGDADPAERMAELDALAVSAGATVVGTVTGRRQHPDAATRQEGGWKGRHKRAPESDDLMWPHAARRAQRSLERQLQGPGWSSDSLGS